MLIRMWFFVVLCSAVLLGCATTSPNVESVTVIGIGNTLDEAKQHAFEVAIKHRGAVVISDLEIKNSKVTTDNIGIFSAGYVDSYEVINISDVGGRYEVLVSVTVSDSRLRNFLLGSDGDASNIAGKANHIQLASFLSSKKSGDDLIREVFRFYPIGAFNVNLKDHYLESDINRNVSLTVPYEISWRPEFITAVQEMLEHVAGQGKRYQKISSSNRPPAVAFHRSQERGWVRFVYYYTRDVQTVTLIQEMMSYPRYAMLLLQIKNKHNNVVFASCLEIPGSLYGFRNQHTIGNGYLVNIHDKRIVQGRARINIIDANVLKDLDKITIDVVPANVCR